ncbi:MAG TPA: hypothetical protein VLT61_01115 [Anaeromyxobacteraceae bacterium]|nr:hypothetical protein [Anaeromyxobacteraceae bacterium]
MKMPKKHSATTWLGAAALGVALAACGSGAVSGSGVTGVALNNGPVSGTVSLTDSSAQTQSRQVATRPDGSFSIDVTGLTPPYMLKVQGTAPGGTSMLEAGDSYLYAVTGGSESLDINPITDVAYTGAVGDVDPEYVFNTADAAMKKATFARASSLLDQLETVLAPLFQLYGISDPEVDKEALRALLADVTVTKVKGTVTVTNTATGGVIYQGPLSDLSSGTFDAANMPAGPGTIPPPAPSTCTSFTYSAWNACQADGTQSRTVTSASPAGCTGGSPVTAQSCTYVPPVTTCTGFTYSTWGACQADGTQSRTLISSSPTGCTGGSPVTTQSCTYVPPVTTCSSFTYSAWGTCQSNNTQTRTVTSSSPTGCTGGTPVTTQSCTYVPPVTTCSSFTYSAWGTCQSNNTQTRTVTSSSPAGCTGGTPVTTQSCTYVAPIDGKALYTQYCSGCHGTSKQTATAAAIQNAINSNIGGMGSLKFLTPEQIAAIDAAY